jgi:alkylated DNA repair dioxygenase AlkB
MTSHQAYQLSRESSLDVSRLPDELLSYAKNEFENMYNNRPTNPSSVFVGPHKEEVLSERAHKAYMKTPKFDPKVEKSYMFSGSSDMHLIHEDLPTVFKPFLEFLNKNTKVAYNQVVVNYYKDGTEHIPMHGDCDVGFAPDANVVVVHLDNRLDAEVEKSRLFTVKARKETKDVNLQLVEVPLSPGTIVTMKGACQKEYRHGVKKDDTKYKRISLTFRSFI